MSNPRKAQQRERNRLREAGLATSYGYKKRTPESQFLPLIDLYRRSATHEPAQPPPPTKPPAAWRHRVSIPYLIASIDELARHHHPKPVS